MSTEDLRKLMEIEVKNIRKYQTEHTALRNQRQVLNGQLCENDVVKGELEFLDEGDEIFKQVGPVLVKQDLAEAKTNVTKRMEFIKAEMHKLGASATTVETQLKESREKLYKIQNSMKEKKKSGGKKKK